MFERLFRARKGEGKVLADPNTSRAADGVTMVAVPLAILVQKTLHRAAARVLGQVTSGGICGG